MKDKLNDDYLDPGAWIRLPDGTVVERAHYERIASPWVSVHLTQEEQKEFDRKFRAGVREIYRKRGYPIPDKYKD